MQMIERLRMGQNMYSHIFEEKKEEQQQDITVCIEASDIKIMVIVEY